MNITISPRDSPGLAHSDFFSDHSMACRLERTEATANAHFVEARAQLEPNLGAQWIEVAGVYLMLDGVRSPCTQTRPGSFQDADGGRDERNREVLSRAPCADLSRSQSTGGQESDSDVEPEGL